MRFDLRFPMAFAFSLAASCLAADDHIVKVASVPGAHDVVKATLGKDGILHVVYETGEGPAYAQSRDNAVTFSKPLPSS